MRYHAYRSIIKPGIIYINKITIASSINNNGRMSTAANAMAGIENNTLSSQFILLINDLTEMKDRKVA